MILKPAVGIAALMGLLLMASAGATSAIDCIKPIGDDHSGSVELKNTCDKKIEVEFCLDNLHSSFACSTNKYGSMELAPNHSQPIAHYVSEGRGQILWATCLSPQTPHGWHGPNSEYSCSTSLVDNSKHAVMKTTASGLQYEVITEGKGDHPKATDHVTVNYKGTLLNGEIFDSSYERGQPVTFPLDNVIPGWTEGVQLMTVGSKYKFIIPANLAYGERGAGSKIGPNATLVFEVELLGIQ